MRDYEFILEALFEGAYIVDLDRRIRFWNRSAELITGFSAQEVVGSRCSDNLLRHVDEHGTEICKALCPLHSALEAGTVREGLIFLHHKKGHRVPVSIRVAPIRDESGKITAAIEFFTDNSTLYDLSLRLHELEALALLDPLTEISNRTHLESQIEACFQEKQRYGLSFGIIFLDIDHFKKVNDLHGHQVGDMTLKTLAGTLRASGRPFDTFGRWGGEEFVGVIRNVNRSQLQGIAERCRALIASSTVQAEVPLRVTVSIGAALARDADTINTLIQRADTLMYESKRMGRNRVTTEMESSSVNAVCGIRPSQCV